MNCIYVTLVYEDELSEFILIKVLNQFGNKYCINTSINSYGYGQIKTHINGYNQACKALPHIILTDLDNRECPLALIKDWFKNDLHPNMIFRVAVKEVEAWILADAEGFAKYLGISKTLFPRDAEAEEDPKRKLINLTRKSRKRAIRQDIVPVNENASVGPSYNARLMDFVYNHWDLNTALENSESLKRMYTKLKNFTPLSS